MLLLITTNPETNDALKQLNKKFRHQKHHQKTHRMFNEITLTQTIQ